MRATIDQSGSPGLQWSPMQIAWGGDVRMEDWREHPALGRQPRIIQGQRDLDHVALHSHEFVVLLAQAADPILDLVTLRRRSSAWIIWRRG